MSEEESAAPCPACKFSWDTVAEFTSALMPLIAERGMVMSPNWVSRTIWASFDCDIFPDILSPLERVRISAPAKCEYKSDNVSTANILPIFIFL